MDLLGQGIMAGSGAVWRVLIDLLALISSLTPLYYMVKCLASSRRPGAKPSLALAAVLAALAIPGLTIIVGQYLSVVVGEEIARSLLFLNAGILMLGLLLTGLIVSAIAWAEIRRDREPQRNQERRQAMGAFISSLTLVCLMIGASEFLPNAPRNDANESRRQERADARASHSERPPAVVAADGAASSASQPKAAAEVDSRLSDSRKQLQTAAAVSTIASADRIGATRAKVGSPVQAAASSTTAVQKSATALTDSGTTASTKPSTTAAADSRVPEPLATHFSDTAVAEKQAADKQNWGRFVEALFGGTAKQPRPMAKQPAPIETVKNERLNFQFRPPDAQWVAADAKRFNRNATAVYVRSSPELFLMIIAERIGVESKLTTEGLLEFCRATMRAASPDALQIEQGPQIVNGLVGKRLVHQATVNGVLLHYVRWLCTYNGFSYQIIVSGRASDSKSVAQECDKALEGFDLIDSFAVCHADGIGALNEFSIAQDGFSLKLGDRGWHPWDKLATVFPSAEFGALRGTTGMVVIPIHFDVLKPARDARLEAFLGILGCANPEPALDKREVIQIDSLPATQCTFERPGVGGGDLYYSLGVAQTDDFDYCFSVWSTKSKLDAASALHDVLSGVSFTPVKKRLPKTIASNGERQRYGKFFNFVGLHYLRARQAFESEPYFLRALHCTPDMTVALENYVAACLENGRHQLALDAMGEYEKAWKDNPSSKLMHAWLLSKVDRPANAIGEFKAIFSGETRNDDYFCAYVRLLEEAGGRDDALSAMDRYLAGGDSLVVSLAKVRCLGEQGKTDQALELLKARRQQAPGNIDVQFALVDALQNAQHYSEAHELAKQMLAEGHESVEVLIRKGVLELQLKRYKDSKATLEDALRRSPGDERIQRYLNRVSGILGEGANVQLKQPVAQVDLPAVLRAAAPPALPADLLADAQAYYRRYVTAIEFEPRKTYRTSTYQSIQVLTDTGAARFGTLQFDFDPLAERIFVNRLEVFDDQGKTIAAGDVADYFVADENQGDVASHRKTLHVPIAGIRTGSRIEICVTKEDIVPPSEMPYSKHFFAAGSPIAREIVSVAADPKRLAWMASAGLTAKTSDRGLYWQVDGLPAMHFEPDAADFDALAPFVRVVDKQCTWKSEVDAYREEIQNLMPVSEEIRKLAADLTHDRPDRAGKTAALVDYLQRRLAYKAIEFGHRARVMNPAEKTLHNRYGDCKDHSLLLCQLLQAAGLSAQLVLVEAGGNAANATPSLDQFNHMIVCLHEDEGDRFIDPTDKESDPNLRVPLGLAGKQALLLDWDHPRLVQVPEYPAGSNTIDVQRTVRIDAEGTVQADDRISYSGYYASTMRRYFKAIDPTRRKTVWQAGYGSESDINIQDLGVEGLEDRQRSVVISVNYKVSHALHPVQRQCVGLLPAPWEATILAADRMDHRAAPLWLHFPLVVKATINIEPPAGYSLPSAASLAVASKAGLFQCQRTAVAESNGLRLQCEASRPAGRFPPAFYADYVDQVEQARLIFTPDLVLNQRDK